MEDYEALNLSPVTNLTQASLYKPRKVVVRKSTGQEELPQIIQSDMREEVHDLKKQIDSSYNNKQIHLFMTALFGEKRRFSTNDLNQVNDDTYIKLILSMLKHDDKSSFYKVELEEEQIIKDQYLIPMMTFKKKGK
jgi:hypothetical protein